MKLYIKEECSPVIFHLERRELAKQDLDGALFFINELLQSHNSFTQQGDFCRSAVSRVLC